MTPLPSSPDLEELERLLKAATPDGPWKAGRADMAWFNAAGEQQANVYHVFETDGLHLGQPLPLTIATCHSGVKGTADPQATAELIVFLRNHATALLSAARRAREMEEALKTLRTQLLPDALCKEKGGLTSFSRRRCMAIVKAALPPAEQEGKRE